MSTDGSRSWDAVFDLIDAGKAASNLTDKERDGN